MKVPMQLFVGFVCLWLAGGCQRTVAPHVAVAGTTPDFLLVVLGCLALRGNRRSGTILGFCVGVLEGALADANLMAYTISRTIAGFVTGWFATLEFESNALVAFIVVGLMTVVAQALLVFLAPPADLASFLLATIGSAMYNGVLAMPLDSLLRRSLSSPPR